MKNEPMVTPSIILRRRWMRGRGLLKDGEASQPERDELPPPRVPHLAQLSQTRRSHFMRYFLASALFTVLGTSQALAESKPVPFIAHEYDDPQPTQTIFKQTWPNLIKENNAAGLKNFGKPSNPRHNEGLFMYNAVLPIKNGSATISIVSALSEQCHGEAVGNHDNFPHIIKCPARLTITQNGKADTFKLKPLCRFGKNQIPKQTYAVYNDIDNSIRVFAKYATKNNMEPALDQCGYVIKIP